MTDRIAQGTKAPHLYVRYQCPGCAVEHTGDAYDGPPRCQRCKKWLVALRLADPIGYAGPHADKGIPNWGRGGT